MRNSRLALAALALLLGGVVLVVHLAQSFALGAGCKPNNHQIADPRLVSSTFLDLGQTAPPGPALAMRSRTLFVAAGTTVTEVDERGRVLRTMRVPGPASGLALDRAGALYVTGTVTAASPPAVGGFPSSGSIALHRYGRRGMDDAYVLKANAAGRVMWWTKMGGTNMDEGQAIAVNSAGDIWVTGTTTSDDFPLRYPLERHYHGPSLSPLPPQGASFPEDAWVARLDQTGRLRFSSYLGGSENDEVTTIGFGHETGPVLYGWTASPDFVFTRRILVPPTPGVGYSTAITFVVRLTRRGRMLSSTPVVHGGTPGGTGMVLVHAGIIDLLAGTEVIKLDSSAARILQRISLGRTVAASAIAPGPDGTTYVTGSTGAATLRLASPLQAHFHQHTCGTGESIHFCSDAFVSGIDRRGRLLLGSYLGGARDDGGETIAVDASGRIVVLGSTDSPDFPLHGATVCTITGSMTESGDDGPTTTFLSVIRREHDGHTSTR